MKEQQYTSIEVDIDEDLFHKCVEIAKSNISEDELNHLLFNWYANKALKELASKE